MCVPEDEQNHENSIQDGLVASYINMSGLAVGMACTILTFLWVQNELMEYYK